MNDLSRAIARDRVVLQEALGAVLDSGSLVLGLHVDRFEAALASLVGVRAAVGVASGTDALTLAMQACMPEERSVVVTAANAGGYSTTAARRAKFEVRYADVDPASHSLTCSALARVLTPDVGVVVVTHLYGRLTDMREIVDLCRGRGIRVIEDCAQAIGARLGERAAGSFGDMSAFSFYPTKNLGALGDAGAIVTDDLQLAARVRLLRAYGWNPKYRVVASGGMNSRLDELQAAFLLARLPSLDALNERRRSIVSRYVDAAVGTAIVVLAADGPHHAAHLAVAVTSERDAVRARLASLGINTDIHFPVPDHQQPGFDGMEVSLPVTEQLSAVVLSLPCFPELRDEEVGRVCDAIRSLR